MSDVFDPNAFIASAGQPPATEASPDAQPSEGGGGFNPDEFIQAANEEKYGTPGQMLQTAVEGAGRGLIGPVAPFIQTHVLGQDPTEIRERAETNPIIHGAGEAAGLIGGALTGTGEAAALTKVGEAAAAAANLAKPVTTLAKIGSAVVKGAAENALYQVGDEASKYVLNDPGLNAESAIANIGLAAAIGGAASGVLGSVHPLWSATVGPKTEELLSSFSKRLNGTGGPSELLQHADSLGLKLTPEVEAAMSNDPLARALSSKLEQTDTTKVGRTFQEALSDFRNQVDDKMLEISGKERSQLGSEVSSYETGKNLAETAASEFEAKINPSIAKLEEVKGKLKDEALLPDTSVSRVDSSNPYKIRTAIEEQPGTVKSLSERIAQIGQEEGWLSTPRGDEARMVLKALKDLKGANTIGNLVKIGENIGNQTRSTLPFGMQTPLSRAGTIIRNAIDEAVHDVSIARLGVKDAGLVNELLSAKAGFREAALLKEALNDRLKTQGSVSGFAKTLRAMGTEDGEKVLNRLNANGDANLLEVLKKDFPQTAEKVKAYHIDRLIKASTKLEGSELRLNANKYVKNIEKMSPELRNFVFSEEQQQGIQKAYELAKRLEDKTHNWSNTARTVDKLTEQFGSSALGAVAFLSGHGALGFMAPFATGLGKEGLDSARLGLLKFLGSEQPVNAAGFKAMVNLIEKSIQGQGTLVKAVQSVFKAGSQVVPGHLMPSEKSREKLDKQVSELQDKPDQMIRLMKGDVAHYMPENQTALTEAQTRAVTYLQGIKPQPFRASPLDREIAPSKADTARYNRALDIANTPAIVLQHVKNGTVQISDLQDLKSMYPTLYKGMAAHLSNEMTVAHEKGTAIPYATRMGLSLFLGQAVDSTMQPLAIIAAQPQQAQAPQQGQANNGRHPGGSLNKLGKGNADYMTPNQASEAHKNKN